MKGTAPDACCNVPLIGIRRLKRKLFTSVPEAKEDTDTISAEQATQVGED